MEEYLMDRETLGKFVDELIKKKALPVNNPAELNDLREKAMRSLDDKIGIAIFGRLTEEQNTEINQLMDSGTEDPNVFNDFFKKSGINIEQIMTDTMQGFAKEFLGGQNG